MSAAVCCSFFVTVLRLLTDGAALYMGLCTHMHAKLHLMRCSMRYTLPQGTGGKYHQPGKSEALKPGSMLGNLLNVVPELKSFASMHLKVWEHLRALGCKLLPRMLRLLALGCCMACPCLPPLLSAFHNRLPSSSFAGAARHLKMLLPPAWQVAFNLDSSNVGPKHWVQVRCHKFGLQGLQCIAAGSWLSDCLLMPGCSGKAGCAVHAVAWQLSSYNMTRDILPRCHGAAGAAAGHPPRRL